MHLLEKKWMLLFLSLFLLAVFKKDVLAKGTCNCTGPLSGACTIVSFDNCDADYRAVCSTASQCIGDTCTCVKRSTATCGGLGQYCCTTGDKCNAGLHPSTNGMGCVCLAGTLTPLPTAVSDARCKDGNSIDTAIGCIDVSNLNMFLGDILGWGVGIGGGIAFLLIIYASFMIMTSSGNPERLKAGQELLTSAISGLIMLIFSVFILNFIGVDILGLGKFGFGG